MARGLSKLLIIGDFLLFCCCGCLKNLLGLTGMLITRRIFLWAINNWGGGVVNLSNKLVRREVLEIVKLFVGSKS